MNQKYVTDQRLAEIREALMYTDWLAFDRADVNLLVDEVDRLRAELQRKSVVEQPVGSNA